MYNPAGDVQGLVNTYTGSSPYYPGDVFGIVFENGTGSGDWSWLAVLNDPNDIYPISNGSDFYNYFVVDDDFISSQPSKTKSRKAKRDSGSSITTQAPTSSATGEPIPWENLAYPANPIVSQPDLGTGGVITGYILDNDPTIGVLSIPSFNMYQANVADFSASVGQFIQKAKGAGVSKVVIDLQQNYGGLKLLATDVFKQVCFRPFGIFTISDLFF